MLVIAKRNIAPSPSAQVRVPVAPSNRPLAPRPRHPLLTVTPEDPRHPARRPGTIHRAPTVAPGGPSSYFADNKWQIRSLRSFDPHKSRNNYDLNDFGSRGVGATLRSPSVGPERHIRLPQSSPELRSYLLHKTWRIRSLRSFDCRNIIKCNTLDGNWRRGVPARHHPATRRSIGAG